MRSLQVISDGHANWRGLATSLARIIKGIDDGAEVDAALFDLVFDYIEQFVDHSHRSTEEDFLYRLMRMRSDHAAAVLDLFQSARLDSPARLTALRKLLPAAVAGRPAAIVFSLALRRYVEELEAHVRDEERLVLPLAREILTEEDWAEIDRTFLDTNSSSFGGDTDGRRRELFHCIVSLASGSVGMGERSACSLPAVAGAREQSDVVLHVRGMESQYGRIKALKGINLDVRRGETVALVGANGAGKTTCLRTLSGVQPLSAGQILFKGEDISKLRSDLRVRRGICQIPEGRQVFGPLSIEDNLRLGAFTQPRHQVDDDLERVFAIFPVLEEKRALPAGNLSGGQQQMLAIGRALMGRPSMLLLDEPSLGLAPLLVQEVFNVIKTLKAQGMTILLVEQNAFAALEIADRGYVLETGRVTLTGTGQELLGNEDVRAAYLGM